MTKKIKVLKVLIVDDDILMRYGLRDYLKSKGLTVFEADNANEAETIVFSQRPDAVVLDIVIPLSKDSRRDYSRSEGINLAKTIKEKSPEIGVVLLSAYEDRGAEVWSMVQKGARGIIYKLKGCLPSDLEVAIRESIENRVAIDAEVSTSLNSAEAAFVQSLQPDEQKLVEMVLGHIKELTPREREIGGRFAASRTIEGVGEELSLTSKTVQNYVNRIYIKVGLNELGESKNHLRKSSILIKAFMVYRLNLLQDGKEP